MKALLLISLMILISSCNTASSNKRYEFKYIKDGSYGVIFSIMHEHCHELQDEKACKAVYELEDEFGAN